MANVGEKIDEVEFIPLPEVPVEEPAPAPVEAPQPEEVPV